MNSASICSLIAQCRNNTQTDLYTKSIEQNKHKVKDS